MKPQVGHRQRKLVTRNITFELLNTENKEYHKSSQRKRHITSKEQLKKLTVDFSTETKWIRGKKEFATLKGWKKITVNLEFYTSKNEGHIFRPKGKKTKKIHLQETHVKRTFSWPKKNNLRGRKMQAEIKTNEKSK